MLFENMTKKRATIIISGDVQDIGFRGKIMRIGHKAGLTGVVENLPVRPVKIICEGEEKTIKNYLKHIKTIEDVEIDDINCTWGKTKGTFKGFTIKYSDQKAEMAQGFSTAGKKLDQLRVEMHTGFSDLKEETKKTHENLDNMRGKLDKIVDGTVKTHEKLDGIGNTLGDVVERYGEFGEKMTKLEHDIGDLTYQIKRLVDHVVGEETNKK